MKYGSCAATSISAEIGRASGSDLNAILSFLRVDVDMPEYKLVSSRRAEVQRVFRSQPNHVRLALQMYNRLDDNDLAEWQALMPTEDYWTARFPPVSALADLELNGDQFSIRAPTASSQAPKGTPSKGRAPSRRRKAATRDSVSRGGGTLALPAAAAPSSGGAAGGDDAAVSQLRDQLNTAMLAIRDLQQSRADLEADFDSRAQEGARQLFTDAARGRDDVPIVPSKLTDRQLARVTAYDLEPSFKVASWERGDSWAAQCLKSPKSGKAGASRSSLRNLLFNCRMRKEDQQRLLGAIAKPAVWSNPPSLKPSDEALLGDSGCAADGRLYAQQEKHMQRAQPLMAALNTLSRASAIIPSRTEDPLDRVALAHALEDLLEQLSDSVHLVAFDVSALHKQRRKLLADAVGGTAVDVDLSSDEDDWELGDSALYDAAKSARSIAKDLGKLSNKRGKHQPRNPTGKQGDNAGGGASDKQSKKSAKRKAYKDRKKAKDKASKGGNAGKGNDKPKPKPADGSDKAKPKGGKKDKE